MLKIAQILNIWVDIATIWRSFSIVKLAYKKGVFHILIYTYFRFPKVASGRVSSETSFVSKQPKLEPKLFSALSETRRLFRLFRLNIETGSFGVSKQPCLSICVLVSVCLHPTVCMSVRLSVRRSVSTFLCRSVFCLSELIRPCTCLLSACTYVWLCVCRCVQYLKKIWKYHGSDARQVRDCRQRKNLWSWKCTCGKSYLELR